MVGSEPPERSDSSSQSPDTRDCVSLLVSRFPHLQAVSLALLNRYEPFRDLCEEYQACSKVCDRLERSVGNEALRREYSALRLRLESELLRYIEEHSGSGEREI